MKINQQRREYKRSVTRALIILAAIILLGSSQNVLAQWTQNGNNITTTNNVGIGTATPANKLDVVRGNAGQMAKGFFEMSSFEYDADAKFGVYSSASSAPSAAVTFGATNLQANNNFPGFELQYIYGNTAASNQMRFNYIERYGSGNLANFAANLLSINANGYVTLNPVVWYPLRGVTASPRLGIGTNSPEVPLHVIGDGKFTGSLTVDGNINSRYQDMAEWVLSTEKLPTGTVVVLDTTKSNQVVASCESYDTRVAGVISERPGIALGEKGESKVLVATTGRVRVRVDATRAPIHIGDLLVTSDVPGVAMKSEPVNLGGVQIHRPGTLIGKALEPLEKGSGTILVLLSLQ